MTALTIFFGLTLLVLAWLIIFQKNLVFKLNAWMRENIFNDHVVLFSGRRVAILLFVLGIVAVFSGIRNVIEVPAIPPKTAAEMIAQSREHLAHGEFAQVVNRCKILVRANPSSIEAWELLVAAWSAMGEKDLALKAAENLNRLDPKNALAAGVLRRRGVVAK